MTEVSGGVTGISRAHGGVKMGSCNQLVSNVRLQVKTVLWGLIISDMS